MPFYSYVKQEKRLVFLQMKELISKSFKSSILTDFDVAVLLYCKLDLFKFY